MKRKLLLFLAIFVLPLVLGLTTVISYWGYGPPNADCVSCHNDPGYAYRPDEGYATDTLILDAFDEEAFWDDHDYRKMYIPVGGQDGDDHAFVELMFAQNSTHLFLFWQWADIMINGTDQPRIATADGISICWNINAENFTAAYFTGMAAPATGESVDTVSWKPTAAATNTQVTP